MDQQQDTYPPSRSLMGAQRSPPPSLLAPRSASSLPLVQPPAPPSPLPLTSPKPSPLIPAVPPAPPTVPISASLAATEPGAAICPCPDSFLRPSRTIPLPTSPSTTSSSRLSASFLLSPVSGPISNALAPPFDMLYTAAM
ncbi:hypothetical protein PMIN07_004646 [Paraphaeosphaeria minitans]